MITKPNNCLASLRALALEKARRICRILALALPGVLLTYQVAIGQVSDGIYKVINANSGQSLNVPENGTTKNTFLRQYPYDGSTACQWALTEVGKGQYKLTEVSSGRALSVVEGQGSTVSGTQVRLEPYKGGAHQKFTLVRQPDSNGSIAAAPYYSLVFVHSGMAMQVSITEPAVVNGNGVNPNASLQWGQKIVQGVYDSSTLHAQWTFLSPTDGSAAGANFSMVALPDTQCQTAGIRGSTPQNFYDQTDWINANRITKNISYVMGVGDIQQSFTKVTAQWEVAAKALYALDDTVPYGTVPGNHDFGGGPDFSGDKFMTLTSYNSWFPPSHWANKSYYGGNYVDGLNNGAPSNGSHYDLISASGLDFIIVYMAWHGKESEANWAGRWENIRWVNNVLQAFPDRRAIVVSHEIINEKGQWAEIGKNLYDGIKTNANLFLMLCGHIAPCKEATRMDVYNGHPVWTMLLDYQDKSPALDMGGNGILRHLTFMPQENLITSETYSPSTKQTYYQFSIPYRMHGETVPLNTAPAYYMLINEQGGLAADIIDGNKADGATVDLRAVDESNPHQHWALVPSENMDHFKIISRATGKALSVQGNSTDGGVQIVDSTYTKNNSAQQWDFIDAGKGWFTIRNVSSGLVLNQLGGTEAKAAKLQQFHLVKNAAQRWRVQPVGSYYIRTSSGHHVSIQSDGTTDGTNIVQNKGEATQGFQWGFQSAGEGYLKILSMAVPGSAISMADASRAPGSNLKLRVYDADNSGSQKVGIEPQASGLMKFYFVHDGLSMEVPGDSIDLNTALQQNTAIPHSTKQAFLLQRLP